ncbi:MAG: 3-dehydroquinate synthase [Solobacterium sp.]|nr:3-dehydroquinate synthase [Solobacterium sp.]
MEIQVHTKQRDYTVTVERGALSRTREIIGDAGHAFIVSDSGVPQKWKDILCGQFPNGHMHVFEQGEASKNIDVFREILEDMLECHISRNDILIALGGGVTGDLAGFAASAYMRGIRYVNIPTTSLSMIDSGIGGKTAIDLNGVKNCVGAFWQPYAVIVDPDILSTLPERHLNNGMAEAVKEGLIRDPGLFALFEQDDWKQHLDEIITRCLVIKRDIVERDERESGERKLLNFGHTFGHAYESWHGFDTYLHGECVAMGMMTVLKDPQIRQRLHTVLQRLQLPETCSADREEVIRLVMNDKKADHGTVTVVQVDEIGNGHLETWSKEQIRERLEAI